MEKLVHRIVLLFCLVILTGKAAANTEWPVSNRLPVDNKNGIIIPESVKQELEATLNAEISQLNFTPATFTTDTDSLSSGSIGELLIGK